MVLAFIAKVFMAFWGLFCEGNTGLVLAVQQAQRIPFGAAFTIGTNLIGFSAGGVRFEAPGAADIVLDTTEEPAEVSIQRLCSFMEPLLHNGPTSLPNPDEKILEEDL